MPASDTDISEIKTRRPVPVRHLLAVVAGNSLEFYDFLCYAIFAVYIGTAFFPAHEAWLSLLMSLAAFGIGFVMRPVGAVVLGGLGDRAGRKPAMIVSFALMGLGMLGIALTPSYAQIGIAAPIIIVVIRLVQGFALGGEFGPTTAYLVEAAPPHRRALYGSLQFMSQSAAMIAAAGVGMALAAVLDRAALEAWGWRVAFLIGVVIVPFGLLLRRTLPETLHATARRSGEGLREQLRPYRRVLICGLVIFASGTISTYVITYLATYGMTTLHLPPGVSIAGLGVTATVSFVVQPFAGLLSDRFGRKPVMLIPGALTLAAILPAFWIVTHHPTAPTLYVVMGALTAVFALTPAPVLVTLTEMLPARVRSGTVATLYAIAVSIFGGFTQSFVVWLMRVTGDPLTPAYYWTVAMAIGVTAMIFLPESAPRKTGK